MDNAVRFEKTHISQRIKSMLKVDLRRMIKSRLFYILIACSLLIPIVMTVMLCMMDGQVSVDPQTGKETVMEGPESVWQSIGTLPTTSVPEVDMSNPDAMGGMAAMGAGMDVMAMCNINMMFMGVAVFICLFISEDFRSGYAKNLFTLSRQEVLSPGSPAHQPIRTLQISHRLRCLRLPRCPTPHWDRHYQPTRFHNQ